MPMNARLLRPLASRSLFDADAAAYLTAVQNADNQALEPAVRNAITAFVIGCKQDGIWSAIKASCLLMGARTLSGALTPLVGTAPTNNGPFVSGDYNRKTGLIGNGTTKWLDANRNNNADPQDSQHLAAYVETLPTAPGAHFIGGGTTTGRSNLARTSTGNLFTASRNSVGAVTAMTAAGFVGISRADSAAYTRRIEGASDSVTSASQTPQNVALGVFVRGAGVDQFSDARLAFYSIGESLDLALLDSRVSTLYTAIGAAIP